MTNLKITELKYPLVSSFFIFLFFLSHVYGQHEEKLFFIRNNKIPVILDSDTMKFPWAGGLNNGQFFNIDINLDGVQDHFIFEKSDNEAYTFLSNNKPGEICYTYAPEYEHRFPNMENWAVLADFNNDGKKDIFTHIPSGAKLYKNTSSNQFGVKKLNFKKEEDRIFSYDPYSNNPAVVSVTAFDLPAFDDIDGDGDLDILTFGPVGMFIEYHENQCMDKGGDCSKLDLSMVNRCWGNFAENESNNGIELNAKCIWPQFSKLNQNRHIGSTLATMDIDGDGDKDLLLGDKSNTNMVLITNGGDKDSAHIVEVDTAFPSNDEPVNLDMFPAPFKVDINNDKILDLVVSVNVESNENRIGTWYYENKGSNTKPDFKLTNKKLIQEDMIDVGMGSHPTFFDYNNDGLLDLLISSFNFYTNNGNPKSKIYYFENNGTKDNPSFKFITEDWEDLHKNLKDKLGQSIQPTFGDLNGDGSLDMFIGNEDGELFYFENKANAGEKASFEGDGNVFVDDDGNPLDVGIRASPDLFDLNEDGLLDLIIGERNGHLNYYENQGTKEIPKFKLINDTLGGVVLSPKHDPTMGQPNPKFFKRNGKIELFIGSEYGSIYYYDNISGNINGEFNRQDSAFQNIGKGINLSLDLADLNQDGFLDLIYGTNAGGVRLFMGEKYTGTKEEEDKDPFQLRLYPNPSSKSIYLDFDYKNHSEMKLSIRNILGYEILNKKIQSLNNIEIDIKNYAPGIYYATLSNHKIKQTAKFIKTK